MFLCIHRTQCQYYKNDVMARRRRGLRAVARTVQQHYLPTYFANIIFNNVSRSRPVGKFPVKSKGKETHHIPRSLG